MEIIKMKEILNQIKNHIRKHYQLTRSCRKINFMGKGQIRDNNICRHR